MCPRGSVLGLLEFISYTDDVTPVFKQHSIKHHLFADDMVNSLTANSMNSGLRTADTTECQLRLCRAQIGKRAFSYSGTHAWNTLLLLLHSYTGAHDWNTLTLPLLVYSYTGAQAWNTLPLLLHSYTTNYGSCGL